MTPRALDVSRLPQAATGPRAPIWWGVALMIAIESTAFLLSVASYFYLRGHEPVWPPTPPGPRATTLGAAGVGLLVLSLVPMALSAREAVRERLRPMRRWLVVATVMGLGFVALRVLELRALPFRWDSHAHGSLFWIILGMHTFHGVVSSLENLLILALLFRGPLETDHFSDVEVNALYWYFVVASLALVGGVLYLDPVLS